MANHRPGTTPAHILRMRVDSLQERAQARRIRRNSVDPGPGSTKIGPKLAELGWARAKFCPAGPILTGFRPTLRNFDQHGADLDQSVGEFGRHRPNFAQERPNRPMHAQNRPKTGFCFDRTCLESVQIRPGMCRFGANASRAALSSGPPGAAERGSLRNVDWPTSCIRRPQALRVRGTHCQMSAKVGALSKGAQDASRFHSGERSSGRGPRDAPSTR